MLAPIDKLRSGRNRIIQVVVTRNCDIFNCSNCTQLLPFRKDTREMSLECLEMALQSVADWPGVVACFGGNPCTHSKFEEVCRLWREIIPDQSHRGLWTNDLRGHGAIVKETFWPRGTFNLNVHGESEAAQYMREWLPNVPIWGETVSSHGGMLLDYRDYGLSEEEWVRLRERCPIMLNWSGAIYERDGLPHAYPCEVMGALDGVRKESNGILAEPGWWKKSWAEFGGMERLCVGCGVPLNTRGHLDSERVYDISPSWSEAVQDRSGSVMTSLHESMQDKTHELTDYIGLRKP